MSEFTIDKYIKRYKEIWREKLDEVIEKNDGQDIEMVKEFLKIYLTTRHTKNNLKRARK